MSNNSSIIVAFEPTGHYWLNINKYFKDTEIKTVLIPTQTVKQEKGVHDGEMVKSDSNDAILIARLTSEGKYVKPIERDGLYQNIYSGYSKYEDIQKEINRIKNKIHVWNDKFFPELEHVYKINSVVIKAIYERQLLPSEISGISEENFVKLMKENNPHAKINSIKKVKELASKTGINPDKFTKKNIQRLYERYIELLKEKEDNDNLIIAMESENNVSVRPGSLLHSGK